jgi:hypothetical protein
MYDGQKCANVLHYKNSDGSNSLSPIAIADRIAATWIANIKSYVSTTLSLVQVDVIDLGPDSESGAISTAGLPSVGGNVAPPLPNHVSVVMSLRTAIRGRSFRGRMYTLGWTEDYVKGNVVEPTLQASILPKYESLRILEGATGEPNYQMHVLSYFKDKAVRLSPVATPVTAITSDWVVDSQRRRLPGRGR